MINKKNVEKNKAVNLWIPRTLYNEVKEIAEKKCIPINTFMRFRIVEFLQQIIEENENKGGK